MPTIQNRRATAAQWAAANPVLAAGELGFELDTNKVKIGDGLTAWRAVDYLVGEQTAPGFEVPVGFRGLARLPMPDIRRGGNDVKGDLVLDSLRPPAQATYYTASTATSTGTGTKDDPATLANIYLKEDVGTIRFLPGEYFRNHMGAMPDKALNWIADAPGVYLTGWNAPGSTVWTLASGHIYKTSRSATHSVVDVVNKTSWGDFTVYTKRNTVEEIVNPGEWAIVGSDVYVWCLQNLDLSNLVNRVNIRLQLSVTAGVAALNKTQYVEGIEMWGCSSGNSNVNAGLASYAGGLLIAKDCKVKYNVNDNGAYTKGGDAIFINVEVSSNAMDGFNYHDTQYLGGEFIEINCKAHHNGMPSVGATSIGTNNASTAHEAVTGIRVGGVYEHAAGPVVADVNKAHTWNLGCYAGGQAPGISMSSSQDNSWRVSATDHDDDPAQMWLDTCSSALAAAAYRSDALGKIWTTRCAEANLTRLYPGTVTYEYETSPSDFDAIASIVEEGRLSRLALDARYARVNV